MDFSELLAAMTPAAGGFAATIPENWMQGRTTYGGLTAALCLEAVLRAHPDLPPLRSAQVSSIGPAGGSVVVRPEILRRGKSVAFVGADLATDAGLATRAVFAFGAPRNPAVSASFMPPPDFPPPEQIREPRKDRMPPFARNFDMRYLTGGKPFSGSSDCDLFLWVKHADDRATSLPALLALADMPPPAIFPAMPNVGPISTINWGVNFVGDIAPTGGWFLMETRAETAADGYTSQDMFVWKDGMPVMAGRQSVAIFL